MECCVLLIETGEINMDFRTTWANGSSEMANRSGLRGQPWRDELLTLNSDEQILPVSTIAVTLAYSILINQIYVTPNPILSNTDHKQGHSSRSNTFIASNESTAAGVLMFTVLLTMCNSLLTWSEANLVPIKPVWSQCTSLVMWTCRRCASTLAKTLRSAFRSKRGL